MKSLMTFWGFSALFCFAGAVVPAISRLFPDQINSPATYRFFKNLVLVLWPSSVLGLVETPGNETTIFVTSVAANIVLYLFVGIFLWLSIKRHKAFAAVPAIVLSGIWWSVFSL